VFNKKYERVKTTKRNNYLNRGLHYDPQLFSLYPHIKLTLLQFKPRESYVYLI